MAGRLGDGRVLVAAAAFRVLTVFFFGFGVLPRAARPFVRARLVAFCEPADLAFRRLVRSAMAVDPSEITRRIKDSSIVNVEKEDVIGYPDMDVAGTSYVERQNLSIRTQVRRLTRLTNGFSKKVENLKAAMDLHFTHYNFIRFHRTIRCTPAMEAGVLSSPMTVKELVEMAA